MTNYYITPEQNRVNISNSASAEPDFSMFYVLTFRSPLHRSETLHGTDGGMNGVRIYSQAEVASTGTELLEEYSSNTFDMSKKTWSGDSLSPADITHQFDTNYQYGIDYVGTIGSTYNTVITDVGEFYFLTATIRLTATVPSPYTSETKYYFLAIEEFPYSRNTEYIPSRRRGAAASEHESLTPLSAYELKKILIDSLSAYNLECRVAQTYLISGKLYDIPPV